MISKLTLLALLGLSAANANMFGIHNKAIPARKEIKKTPFGATEVVEYLETAENGGTNKIIKTVYPSNKHFTRDYER